MTQVPRHEAVPAVPPLVESARAGDPESLARLLRQNARLVERTLRRLVGPSPDLEDLVQEVFIAILEGLPRYRGDAQFQTWVSRICVHVACHHLRAPRQRRPALRLVEEDSPATEAPPDEIDARRAFERIHRLFDRLTPAKRVAFLLHVALGHSTREVAALMGSTRSAAKARIWFARREIDAMAREDPLLRRWIEEEVSNG